MCQILTISLDSPQTPGSSSVWMNPPEDNPKNDRSSLTPRAPLSAESKICGLTTSSARQVEAGSLGSMHLAVRLAARKVSARILPFLACRRC